MSDKMHPGFIGSVRTINTATGTVTRKSYAPDDPIEAIKAALDEYTPSDCGCDGETDSDGVTRGHACYFHRIERDLKRAIAKAGG